MDAETPHVVFFPSPSMGHLKPFLRLAAMLESRNCTVTLISTQPTVCAEESASFSSFFSSHPNIKRLEFQILTEKGPDSTSENAFITQFKAINRSVHLLPPLLASLPQPVSAIFSDFVVAASLAQITASHGIPNFIVSTTSARCYSTVAYLPVLLSDTPAKFNNGFDEIQIPGLAPLPKSIIPPSWLDDYDSPSNHLVTDYLIPNAQSLPKVGGVLLNSFNWFEPETIPALLDRRVLSNLPPLYPIGPLEPHELEQNHGLPWLDDQTAESVLYVNFGTRTAMSEDQTRELAKGLESSGFPFLWVLGPNSVDEDEKEVLKELLGESFLERTKNKGMVIKRWVNQAAILAHRSIGGFFNQADWDSVTEAAREGVPMLVWPLYGDHKMNAEVVENAGLGIWVKDWGWGGERLVTGEEAEKRVRELMGDENLRVEAKKVREKAKEAFGVDGSSENALIGVMKMLKLRDCN
ncbi:UDP-glycosyltransferase 708G1-like [Actinidia eriantha]|uniref:UDP-glycosyltransferase 708G1-like n=1 Tax=Actinidia eriantha TaxID=165200 RepID=UPI00258B66B0|nr:UDP-glycosyltransferase 708G1-like [Actinidia eriantha]